jgi:DNA-binding transcriptional LysR family regulator
MDQRDCTILQYLSEDLNLTKAAERLYMTQPALTYRIQQIEKEFNARLIVKTGKGIRFTPEGERVLKFARKMLIDLRNTKEFVESMRKQEEGILKIGVSSYYGLHILPGLLRDFRNLYSKIQFNVTTGWSDEIYIVEK